MLLKALKNFKHAEDTINVISREKGEEFEVTNEDHAQRLIDAELAKKSAEKTGPKETKIKGPEETK